MSRMNEKEQLARDVGYRIRKTRETLRISQKRFAEKLGVSSAHLCGIENGKTGTGSYVLYRMGKRFRSNASYLLHGTEPMFSVAGETVETQAKAVVEEPGNWVKDGDFGGDGGRIRELLRYIAGSSVVKFGILGFFSKFLIENEKVIDKEMEGGNREK